MKELENIINELQNKDYLTIEISYLRSWKNSWIILRLYYEEWKYGWTDLKKDFETIQELTDFLKLYLEEYKKWNYLWIIR